MEDIKDNPTEEESATPGSGDKLIRKIKKHTKKRYSAEDKIKSAILEGLELDLSMVFKE